jgi:hypothetical protein
MQDFEREGSRNDGNQPDRDEAITRSLGLFGQLKPLTPEERAEFDRELQEGAAAFRFIAEIFARSADGSMSPDEAEKWLTALEKIQGDETGAG